MAIQDHRTAPVALVVGLGAAFVRLGRWAGGLLRTIQTARMMQALSEMNDHELARIGITRADIPAYAASLIDGET
jgi:uncharacterized protein YjiS (DUF1127 family)